MATAASLWRAALLADAAYVRQIPPRTSGAPLQAFLEEPLTLPVAEWIASGDGGPLLAVHQSDEEYFRSGFSATIFGLNGQKFLAIRGTEPTSLQDLLAADTQIAVLGLAKDQAIDLYRFWRIATSPLGVVVQYSNEEINYLIALKQASLTPNASDATVSPLLQSLAADHGLGILGSNERVIVVGHSLGGHLAQLFAQMFPLAVESGYTFNAPGISGLPGQLVDSFLRPSGGPAVPVSSYLNLVANHGVDITAALRAPLGDSLRLFNEQSPISSFNHLITKLTDSLALYDLFQRLDPNISLANVTDILDASSNVASRSLESSLESLRRLIIASGSYDLAPVAIGDRTEFNAMLLELHARIAELTSTAPLEVESLVRMSADTLAARALSEEGIAYRYALNRLSPFAIQGINYAPFVTGESLDLLSGDGSTGAITTAWIDDRSQLLSWLNARNFIDGGLTLQRTDGGNPIDFTWTTDAGTREQLHIATSVSVPAPQIQQVFFGGSAADTFQGSSKDDRLYGGAGDDRLEGGAGADYLQGDAGADQLSGGEGADTLAGGPGDDVLDGGAGQDRLEGGLGFDRYVVSAGSGQDVISDSDGLGAIVFNGTQFAGGSGQPGLFWNSDHTVYYTFSAPLSAAGTLHINGQVDIENFHNGDFGISLALSGPDDVLGPTITTRTYLDSGVSADELALYDPDTHPVAFPYGSPANDFFQAGLDSGPWFAGQEGDDLIQGGFGLARLYGGSGNDVIVGGPNSTGAVDLDLPINLLAGGAGQDTLTGSEEPDVLFGDFFSVHVSGSVYEIDGNRWNSAGNGFLSPIFDQFPNLDQAIDSTVHIRPDLGHSTALFIADQLGNPSADQLDGFYNDTLHGHGGDDFLIGGPGSDSLFGDDGNDVLFGDYPDPIGVDVPGWSGVEDIAGFSPLFGQAGDDTLDGGAGDDLLYDLHGKNSFAFGGPGNDYIAIQNFDELLEPGVETIGLLSGYGLAQGGDGNDTLIVLMPQADLDGGGGDDLLLATGFSVTLAGGTGDDQLLAAAFYAEMDGGAGNDYFLVGADLGVGSYFISNTGALPSDVDQLSIPYAPGDYDVSRDGNDLVLELDPDLAVPGAVDAGVAPLAVTLVDWFAGPQFAIDSISFAGSGDAWTPVDAEQALAQSDPAVLDAAQVVDIPFDPGEPETPAPDGPILGGANTDAPAGDAAAGDAGSADGGGGAALPPPPEPQPGLEAPGPDPVVAMTRPRTTLQPQDERLGSNGDAPGASNIDELIAAFFAHVTPPAMTTQEWLNAWFPAGARNLASRESRDNSPDTPADPSISPQPSDAPVEQPPSAPDMSPEEVAQRYREIDEWLAQQDGLDDETLAGFSPAPLYALSGMSSNDAALSLAGMRFGATPGVAQLAANAMLPLQGLGDGFAKLG
jgi:Ca2+-binding RTX toxin-like protein